MRTCSEIGVVPKHLNFGGENQRTSAAFLAPFFPSGFASRRLLGDPACGGDGVWRRGPRGDFSLIRAEPELVGPLLHPNVIHHAILLPAQALALRPTKLCEHPSAKVHRGVGDRFIEGHAEPIDGLSREAASFDDRV